MTRLASPAIPSTKSKAFVWLRDISLFVLVISAVIYWQSKDMLSTDGSVQVSQQNLVSLSGEVSPMLSNSKTNLVYFFAPWCQICSLSIGNLSYLNDQKVNIVVIALDYSSQEEVQTFVDEHDIKSAVFLGNSELKAQYNIQGYPSYYLIDEHFTVVSKSYGYSSAVGLKLREVFGD